MITSYVQKISSNTCQTVHLKVSVILFFPPYPHFHSFEVFIIMPAGVIPHGSAMFKLRNHLFVGAQSLGFAVPKECLTYVQAKPSFVKIGSFVQ